MSFHPLCNVTTPEVVVAHKHNLQYDASVQKADLSPLLQDSQLLCHLSTRVLGLSTMYRVMLGAPVSSAPDMKAQSHTSLIRQCPVSLFPSTVSQQTFDYMADLTESAGVAVATVSNNLSWLQSTLASVATEDAFIRRLSAVASLVAQTPKEQAAPFHMSFVRTDFMLQKTNDNAVKAPKIVEINTIAAGMGPLCTAAGDMHKHIMERHLEDTYGYDSKSVAVNESIPNGTRAFHVAVTAYKKHVLKPVDQKKQVYVMFLVQEKEKNYPDQLQMELDLWDTYKIPVIRKTLQQLSAGASKVTSEGYLLVDNCHVAVVYYRSCYTPRDFKSEKDWATFTSVETSRAVKCPSVAFHLSGCKKVQHALNQPNTLTDLKIPESNLPTALVDSHEFEPDCGPEQAVVTQAAIEDAINHPELWVLKPQREGGGNNLWNDEMVAYLEENQNNWTKLQPFILMKRILVTPHIAALCKAGYVNVVPAIPEIGMFSYQLVHTEQYPELAEQENWSATGGYLVRTKTHTTTEGGVSSGHAFIDSLQIV